LNDRANLLHGDGRAAQGAKEQMPADIKDIEVVMIAQRICQNDVQTKEQAEAILAQVSPAVREKVIDAFRTNEKLRDLFPEKCFFDDLIQ
jgi:hypothetical protein